MPESPQAIIAERYRQLIQVLSELTSILNTELILSYVVDAAAKLCDSREAWILFPDQINRVLCIETGCFTNEEHYKGLSVPIDSSLEGWVYSNQQAVMITDMSVYDNRYGDLARLPGMVIKSLIAAPMTSHGKPIGVLEVANKHLGEFTSLDQEILVSFVNQAAICIDNSHHFLQTDLVAELVHELRTPLAALNTALSLLQRDDLPGDKHEQISQVIKTEFSRLTDLTTAFLDFARLESGRVKFKPSRFDLTKLIRESVEIMQMEAEGKGITISYDLPAKPLVLTADKDKIKQVMLNLLNNAIQYNRPGGMVHIISSRTHAKITFSVKNNGLDIPAEDLPHLFDRFYRIPYLEREAKGSGLGLTICKQIVEAHKGEITVSSAKGHGSTFTVLLPIHHEF